ncbi:hypothetical protein BDN71DRAFT_1484603 [Pleurotus eryngii]|uniref:Uncharacterized protein n=1 Tax=Pleurotus eryngii TaxID=5323 RepID=A0A9P5ZLS2_PLEER|nr:hypothetical protein BDN71DRAFT_1484603 [Pleurotus eryngii]
MLSFYTNGKSLTYSAWGASSLQSAVALDRGQHCTRILCLMCCQFIIDHEVLPLNPFGDWNKSMLADKDLLGDKITAMELKSYLAQDDVMKKHGITRIVGIRTCECWLCALGYRPDGQPEFGPQPEGWQMIVWFHDESIFYAHDRRRKTWYHKDAAAKPYAKGNGASLMFVNFISADHGWLSSPDGTRNAHCVIKPGKNHDSYFDSDDILDQVQEAMDILEEFYPKYQHVLVYDNVMTHLKHPNGSLSALKVLKNPSKSGKNWLVEVSQCDESGNRIYTTAGGIVKTKVKMHGAKFSDEQPQSLYFPDGHIHAGLFKGMVTILDEHRFSRFVGKNSKLAQCPKFQCKGNLATPFDCCYFADIDSLLEVACKARSFEILFLPKFHCELNFIEQYDLEKNAVAALEAVPLETMRQFASCSHCFMDAYSHGLNGRQAAWAAKKYCRHHILLESILDDLEKSNII